MDNFKIELVSEGRQKLIDAFKLLQQSHAIGYAVTDKGMVFFWARASTPEYTPLPFKMDLAQCAEFAWGWLQQADYGKEPDHDGDNGKGFRLYCEDWGHVAGRWEAFVAVEPCWAMYGK